MGIQKYWLILALSFFGAFLSAQNPIDSTATPVSDPIVVSLTNLDLIGVLDGDELQLNLSGNQPSGQGIVRVNGAEKELAFTGGKAKLSIPRSDLPSLYFFETEANQFALYHFSETRSENARIRKIPLWTSLLPPLIAILMALLLKEVVIALFSGIWIGAFIAAGMHWQSLGAIIKSFWDVLEKYIVLALNDGGHLAVILFSMLIGGMVAIISRNGGMAGVVLALSRYANSPRNAQFITWLLGVAIFFDDYANTLIVGNTMRSVTDKFKISREKLAYIVDSTAAPVAAVAFITTWIGTELTYIKDNIALLSGYSGTTSEYAIFLSSLKYSFYPLLTLPFILFLIFNRKDYGPMLKAERRARQTGQVSPAFSSDEDEPNMEDLSPVPNAPKKWFHAVIPVLVVIFVTIYGLLYTGMEALSGSLASLEQPLYSWSAIWQAMQIADPDATFFMKVGSIIGSSDSYTALLWASISGVLVAIIITTSARIMNLWNTIHTMITGLKTIIPAIIILTLAWALAITTQELHTADYLSSLIQDQVAPYWMPPIVFVLAAAIAFSTGSSWSTMAILYPIAIPLTWAVCISSGWDQGASTEVLLNVIAVVLAASVLGDHCSPISDTTILSSLASDCNHIDHVRTQLPYALTVGGVSILAGFIAAFLGGGALVCLVIYLLSLGILYGIVVFMGKKVDDPAGAISPK